MMFVPVETDPQFKWENPQTLFEGDVVSFSQEYGWDVTADGTKFLMVKPSNPELAVSPIRYVLNWFEELKQKVPTQ